MWAGIWMAFSERNIKTQLLLVLCWWEMLVYFEAIVHEERNYEENEPEKSGLNREGDPVCCPRKTCLTSLEEHFVKTYGTETIFKPRDQHSYNFQCRVQVNRCVDIFNIIQNSELRPSRESNKACNARIPAPRTWTTSKEICRTGFPQS